MPEREDLEKMIAVLETQRGVLGDALVDAMLAPLRARLAPQAEPEQRKQVTVLFADVHGLAPLADRMGLTALCDLTAEYFRRWNAVLLHWGGVVEKFVGDAVMAVFGLPVAREDDPERAVRAALDMQAALTALNGEYPEALLNMRAGVNTGLVVARWQVGRPGGDFSVVGDAVNVASRLEQAALPGSILIGHSTYRHVRGLFDVVPQAPLQIKGRTRPVRAYLVQSARPHAARAARGLEGAHAPLIGRNAVLGCLHDVVARARDERVTHTVTVTGEAGIGKTRLLREFLDAQARQPESAQVLEGRESSRAENVPHAWLRELLAGTFGILESDPAATVCAKLEQAMAPLLGTGGEAAAHVVGVWLGFDLPDGERLSGLGGDPRQLPDRARRYLTQLLAALAVRRPILIVLEDVHWADTQSLDTIESVLSELPGLPLVVVCLARPDLYERRPDWGTRLPRHLRLDLQPLAPDDSRDLARELLRPAGSVPAELYDFVVQRSEGNPFYIEELLRMLVDAGTILVDREPWRVQWTPQAAEGVPTTLAGILQARLDGLPAAEKAALQCASVMGRIFWESALVHLRAAFPGGPADDGDLRAVLASLQQSDFIEARTPSSLAGTAEYHFKHALMRDVVNESVLKRERRSIHARVARWLASAATAAGRAEEFAAHIAAHFDQAEEPDEAVPWYRRAAARAAAQFANAAALDCLARALALIPPADAGGRYALLLMRERLYDLQGARQLQSQDLETLAVLAEQLDDSPEALAQRAEVALRLSAYAEETGDYPAAVAAAKQAVILARQQAAAATEAAGRLAWGRALWRQAQYSEANAHLAEALALATAGGWATLQADCARSLGAVAFSQGQYSAARAYAEQALAIHRALGDLLGQSRALGNLGIVCRNQGDYPAMRAYYQEALRLKREIGDLPGESAVLNNLGVFLAGQGDYAEAQRCYQRALDIKRATGDKQGESDGLNNLGEVALRLGDYARAREYLEQAITLRTHLGDRRGQSDTLVFLSLLALDLGNLAQAQACAAQALRIARDVRAEPLQVHAMLCLGHALLAQSRAAEAAAAYTQAFGLGRKLAEHEAVEPLAGLALACLAQGDRDQAHAYAEEVLAGLETRILTDMEEPLRVYLQCYQVLHACGDPRAAEVLMRARNLLQVRAYGIEDAEQRRMFLEEVPVHRELGARA